MFIYFHNKNIIIPNNFDINEKNMLKIDYWNKSRMHHVTIDDNNYIIKKFEMNDVNFKLEKNIFLYINKICANSFFFKNFMIKYLLIANYNDYHIILMRKLRYNMNHHFLNNISNVEKNNLLFHSLLTLYEMNHKYGIYFNDIYNNSKILNFMINERKDTEKKDTYKLLNNKEIVYYTNNFEIRIIDYGRISKIPSYNTFKYMTKIFNDLYKKNIVSEVLLFFLFFYTTIHNDLHYEKVLIEKINEIINKYILSDTEFSKNSSSCNFDTLFLSYIYDNMKNIKELRL